MIKKIFNASFSYLLCWIVAYSTVMLLGGYVKYLLTCFMFAWSFSGGELPNFIWMVSLVFMLWF